MARWTDSRGGSPLLAIIALLLVAGFFYWLNLEAKSARSEVQAMTDDEASGELVDIIPAQLADSPGSLVGEAGVLRDVAVQQTLGRGVVTIDLAGGNGYPILLGPDLIARGTQLANGQRVTLYGTVYTLNDSIRGAWVDGAAVESGSANAIPGTSSFVLADSITYN